MGPNLETIKCWESGCHSADTMRNREIVRGCKLNHLLISSHKMMLTHVTLICLFSVNILASFTNRPRHQPTGWQPRSIHCFLDTQLSWWLANTACRYVCAHVCTYAWIHVCMYNASINPCVIMHLWMYEGLKVWVHGCMHASTYVCISVASAVQCNAMIMLCYYVT